MGTTVKVSCFLLWEINFFANMVLKICVSPRLSSNSAAPYKCIRDIDYVCANSSFLNIHLNSLNTPQSCSIWTIQTLKFWIRQVPSYALTHLVKPTLQTAPSRLSPSTSLCYFHVIYFFNRVLFYSQVPQAFMTDNSASEKAALRTIWPEASQLLCHFHVAQAEWRWLTSTKNNVSPGERRGLMSAFQKVHSNFMYP